MSRRIIGTRLPATRYPISRRQRLLQIRSVDVVRSVVASTRFRGLIVIGRGSRLIVDRRARVALGRDSALIIGVGPRGERGAVVELASGSVFAVNGVVSVMAGAVVRVGHRAYLAMDDRAYLNSGARLTCMQHVSIGKESAIASNAVIMDSDTHQFVASGQAGAIVRHSPVLLGERCWIGAAAVVLKGVRLGDGVVVAAGATVLRGEVSARSLIGGVPARVLREDVSWEY